MVVIAVGDLVTGNYMYEFGGIVLGHGTKYVVQNIKGLLGAPAVENKDKPRQDAHGDFPGTRRYQARRIEFDIWVDSDAATVETDLQTLMVAFQLPDTAQPQQFVYQRPNGFGKRFLWAVVEETDFDSNADVAHGLAGGSIAIKAADPRIYALTETQDFVNIANLALSGTANVTNVGKFPTSPIIEIPGPCTNPRVLNAADSNREFRIDMVVAAGQTLVVNMRLRKATISGVDYAANIRVDSQWWRLMPGVNAITASRTNNGAAVAVKVRHNDAWMS